MQKKPKAGPERKPAKSLRLHKETLHLLATAQLRRVDGGATVTRCQTYPCLPH